MLLLLLQLGHIYWGLLVCQGLCGGLPSSSLFKQVTVTILPILQVRTQAERRKHLVKVLQQSWDWKPGTVAPELVNFTPFFKPPTGPLLCIQVSPLMLQGVSVSLWNPIPSKCLIRSDCAGHHHGDTAMSKPEPFPPTLQGTAETEPPQSELGRCFRAFSAWW